MPVFCHGINKTVKYSIITLVMLLEPFQNIDKIRAYAHGVFLTRLRRTFYECTKKLHALEFRKKAWQRASLAVLWRVKKAPRLKALTYEII